jgi:tetratricopeptide (TPR) repeat protein
MFLQLGASCLRADRLEDCEDALVEANLLDNRNAAVWAHISLLCLASGSYDASSSPLVLLPIPSPSLDERFFFTSDPPPLLLFPSFFSPSTGTKRLAEAEAALFQALKLGLDHAPLLRELAMGFMSCDRLLTAEDLIRRALASDLAPNPHHRKLLGDVLAGQQQAAAAVEEYKKVMELAQAEGDGEVAAAAAERSAALLATLGRAEEAAAAKAILSQLRAGQPMTML